MSWWVIRTPSILLIWHRLFISARIQVCFEQSAIIGSYNVWSTITTHLRSNLRIMYKDISENLIAAVDLDLLSELDIIWLTVYYLCTRHPIIARFCIPYALSPSVLGLYAEREQRSCIQRSIGFTAYRPSKQEYPLYLVCNILIVM